MNSQRFSLQNSISQYDISQSQRAFFSNQANENVTTPKRKEETSISKFRIQYTLKQKDNQNDRDDFSNQGNSFIDQSSEQSSRNINLDKKKNRMFINVLSDYFEKDKSLQKINMMQKQLDNLQTIIPFKAKYFTRDVASQIIKESALESKQVKQSSSVFMNTFVTLSNLIKCKNLQKSLQNNFLKLWFQKIPAFNPYSQKKLLWDSCMTFITFIILYIFSLRIVFENNQIGSLFDVFQSIIIPISFFLWIIDIFFELNTGVLERGELIVDKVYIASKYFKQRLILDLIGLLPIFYYIINPDYKQITIDFLVVLKLKHFYQTFSRLEHYLSYQQDKKNLIDLLKLVLLILITNHIIALLWYRLATFEKNFLGYPKTWIDNLKIHADSFMEYYQIAVYFATVTVYTVGYGDISPNTILECSFVTLTIIITGIIFAYAINQIGLIMQNINASKTILKEDLMILNKFMQQKNVNQDLRMRIRNYLEHMHRQFQENNSDQQKKVISKISSSLLKEMNQDIYKDFIFSNEIFNSIFSLDFLKSTLDAVEEFVATPGEYLFKEGQRDDQSIYFVFEGKVQITLNQQIVQIIKGQKINSKYQVQLSKKTKIGTSSDKANQNNFQDEDYKLINEFLKKKNLSNNLSKNKKMTNVLLENNSRQAFQSDDEFFDLNRLADEQSGKVINKRQNVKQVALDILTKLKEQNKYFGEYNFFSKECERIYSAQAKEFSRIYKMKRETFLEKIREFQSDFEKFCEIQDEILQFKHSINFKLPCVVCGSLTHQHSSCQQVHYSPNQSNLIQLHNFSLDQERKFQTRYGLKSLKPTINLKYNSEKAQKIQKTHKNEIEQLQLDANQQNFIDDQSLNNQESEISSFVQQESSGSQENEKIEENISDEISESQSGQNDGQNQRDIFIRDRKEAQYDFQDSKQSNFYDSKHILKKPSQQRLSSKTSSTKNQKSIQEHQFSTQFTQQQHNQQDEQQVIQYLNEKIQQKEMQQQGFSSNEQIMRKQSLSNFNKNFSQMDNLNSMSSFNLKQTSCHISQSLQPNISNFVASSINSKVETMSPGRKHSDHSKMNNFSYKDIPFNTSDDLKYNKSNFDNLANKSQSSYTNLQENQLSSKSIKEVSRQKSRQFDLKEKNSINYENNMLLKQFTEHICKQIAYYQKSTLNDREDNSPSLFQRLSHTYPMGNMTENSKTYQYEQFEKMKEFANYFSHNNFSNIILKFNSLQDKKFLQNILKKQKIKSRKRVFLKKQTIAHQHSLVNGKKLAKKDTEENSVSSFNSNLQIR